MYKGYRTQQLSGITSLMTQTKPIEFFQRKKNAFPRISCSMGNKTQAVVLYEQSFSKKLVKECLEN